MRTYVNKLSTNSLSLHFGEIYFFFAYNILVTLLKAHRLAYIFAIRRANDCHHTSFLHAPN